MNAPDQAIVVGAAKRGDPNKRVKILAGVGVGLLVLTQLVPRVLGGDDAAPADEAGATAFGSTSPTTAPPAAPAPALGAPKNPFVPLRLEGPSGDPSTEVVPTSVTDPVGATGGSVPPATGSGSGSTGTTVSGPRLGLLEVLDSGGARVRVDDTVYDVAVDDTFAGSYRVSSIDTASRCGTFVYGDRRVALCEGDEALL